VYARLLGEKIARHDAEVWLINTGWTGGGFGVGERISLAHTRRMVTAALSGELDSVPTHPDEAFGLAIPERLEGVPAELLRPRAGWADKAAYDGQAEKLARMFADNFAAYADGVSEAVREAAPSRPLAPA
jgi:phosphoenolpyruvate carboxykinase (ATP)